MSSSKIASLKDNLETETESVFQEEIKKPKRVGRKPKLKGTKLSKTESQFLKKNKPWGIIFFERNIKNINQVSKLTA